MGTANQSPHELFGRIISRDYSFNLATQYSNILTPGWKFVGTTYDYSIGRVKLWLNGAIVSDIYIGKTEILTNRKIRIAKIDSDSRVFSGAVDDVRIYNRALTSAEVLALHDQRQATCEKASYDSKNGKMHIPCLVIDEGSEYEIDMKNEGEWTFTLEHVNPK